MTSNAAGAGIGLVVATKGALGMADGFLQTVATLTGTALMAWYIVQLHRELRISREEHRKERAELLGRIERAQDDRVNACRECRLASAANNVMAEAATTHLHEHKHEHEH